MVFKVELVGDWGLIGERRSDNVGFIDISRSILFEVKFLGRR